MPAWCLLFIKLVLGVFAPSSGGELPDCAVGPPSDATGAAARGGPLAHLLSPALALGVAGRQRLCGAQANAFARLDSRLRAQQAVEVKGSSTQHPNRTYTHATAAHTRARHPRKPGLSFSH